MPALLWDSSALSKQYAPENGTATVRALLNITPVLEMALAYIVYAETTAILRRKRNNRQMSQDDFTDARVLLEGNVLNSNRFTLLSTLDEDVLAGIALSDTHNINSTDAAMFAAYLRYAEFVSEDEPTCVLVAADARLLRAAEAEGLKTLNPESLAPDDLPAFLSSLS